MKQHEGSITHSFAIYGLLNLASIPESLGTLTMEDSSSSSTAGRADLVLKLKSSIKNQTLPAAVWGVLEKLGSTCPERSKKQQNLLIQQKLKPGEVLFPKIFSVHGNSSGDRD